MMVPSFLSSASSLHNNSPRLPSTPDAPSIGRFASMVDFAVDGGVYPLNSTGVQESLAGNDVQDVPDNDLENSAHLVENISENVIHAPKLMVKAGV